MILTVARLESPISVERSTLETLAGESEPDLDEIFDYYREAIYQAARERAAASAPARQHRIKVQDIAGFRDTLIF